MSRTSFHILYLISIALIVITGIASELLVLKNEYSFADISASLLFFDRFIIELCLVIICSLWLINSNNKFLRFTGYTLTTFFISINIVQMVIVKRGGEFLSRLAVENINHISIITTQENIISLSGLIFLCLLLPFIIEKSYPETSHTKILLKLTAFFLSCIVLLFYNGKLIAKEVLEYKDKHLFIVSLEHTSPTQALYNAIFNDYHPTVLQDFSNEEIEELKKYGFFFNKTSRYPFIKDHIYSSPPPFQLKKTTVKQPNVIVFFTEGFSARSMKTYGSKFNDLTPNLDEFSQHTMVIENYFNHTAATYRGLHGQLCSLFPFYGGNGGWATNYKDLPQLNYLCLNHIFKQKNYETFFFDSHRKDNAFVDELAKNLGFDHVLTAEELSTEYLDKNEPKRDFAMTDIQFYEAFINFLKARKSSNTPLYANLYSLETHAFIDIDHHEISYGDGKNNALNTIHNLDYAFGKFWQYFKNSPYSKNTIIIFTADHAHYTEKSFTTAFDQKGYQRFFIDKIPMLIYDPLRHLPARYDAKNSTSIDFAPSIMHYLGFENRANPFIGSSIFEKNNKEYNQYGVASFGENFYFIDNTIYSINIPSKHQKKLELITKFIKISQQKEITNQLWRNECSFFFCGNSKI